MSDWMEILKSKVATFGQAKIAERLDVSRTAISLVLSGNYPSKTDRIAVRVMEAFGKVECPFLKAEISNGECRGHSNAAIPTSSPRALRHWRACQSCQHKSEETKCN